MLVKARVRRRLYWISCVFVLMFGLLVAAALAFPANLRGPSLWSMFFR